MYTKQSNRYYRQARYFGNDYSLITDHQEIQSIASYYGKDTRCKHYKAIIDSESLFVLVVDGDYSEIWASHYSVPYVIDIYNRIL